MATLTIYPDAGSGGTTCDGGLTNNNANYTTCHDAGTGDGTAISSAEIYINNGKPSDYAIWRPGFTFDTSALTSGATISAATFSVHGTATGHGGTDSANVYSFSPAANNTLANSDYGSFGTTAYSSDIAFSSWNDSAYNDFALNGTGIAAISQTGITRLGLRSIADVAATTPSTNPYAALDTADVSGTSSDPKLVITYTTGGGPTFIPKIMFIN